ncbi:MAG: hypothetical protein K8F52_01395 [Candidatus Scalindua rubra]|uniref:RiboL-PSP-HEPN domain-containing protein n=1 Tax=Candidatus Scalindua brodae TaxID=237368 RepID=A0A0B0EHY5_9BACT|nr:MAG: hypothetical protein SCABRO_02079 [Candidatus Scalindua brodae]MBZ0107297.1 hypothetical protein [Candidatus Scalindua rubra]TWU32078.1 hypothetical protein S225a_18420 [Candidatus Brocadiaceae bacterium S225]
MSIVDHLYTEYTDIISFLNNKDQPSLASDTDKYFKKALLLSSASFFEHEIQNILIDFLFIKESTNDNLKIVSFLKKKAIGANYHTFFAWGEKMTQINQVKTQIHFFHYSVTSLKPRFKKK